MRTSLEIGKKYKIKSTDELVKLLHEVFDVPITIGYQNAFNKTANRIVTITEVYDYAKTANGLTIPVYSMKEFPEYLLYPFEVDDYELISSIF